MSLGLLLTWLFLGLVALFLSLDFAAWKLGGKKEISTMSRYIIVKSYESLAFCIIVLVLTLACPIILIWHWELVKILKEHYNRR